MRALKWFLWIVLILSLGFGVLLATLPAHVALGALGNRIGPLELQELSGSVWNGQAQRAVAHGRDLGALEWHIHPFPLLAGRLDIELGVKGVEYSGSTFASVKGDVVSLRDAAFNFPAERLQAAVDVPGLVPHGQVEVRLRSAELVAGIPRQLAGSARWRDARVSGQAAALFGDLSAEFASAKAGTIRGTVKDDGGPLQLEGSFELALTGFKAEATLRARDGNPQVIEALRWIGQPQADGSSRLLVEGYLLPLTR